MKNKIKWVGSTESDIMLESEIKSLNKEKERLDAEERILDYWIEKTNEDLINFAKDEELNKFAFITHSDLKRLTKENQNETYIVIKAPTGTTLEVPLSENETEDFPHQLVLQTGEGEIVPFLIYNEDINVHWGD